MGINATKQENRQKYKDAKKQLEMKPRITLPEYQDLMQKYPIDGVGKKLLITAWENGIETLVYCDGNGAAYGKKKCGLMWVIAYAFDRDRNQCAILYPASTGGCVWRNEENPRTGRKRDFCDACAKYHGLETTRMLVGSLYDVGYDL